MDKTAIRDAATVILLRQQTDGPQILMGQRGAKAAFMPNKFVFPGGAVDAGDHEIPLARAIGRQDQDQLADRSDPALVNGLQAAAIREVWEETGLILGHPGNWASPPPDWRDFAATGHRPSAKGFHFVFRAITPPGRPRRFDARFFLADASEICGDPDDFSRASDELSSLQWIPISAVREFNLPFITEVVLAEVAAIARGRAPSTQVPFFHNDDEESHFLMLGGQSPLDRENQ